MAAAAQTERFETLYRRYQRPVLAYALRRADRAEALDVAADTFLVAWRRIDDVPDGEAALYWLYGELQRHTAEIVETDEPLSPYASSGPYRGSVSVIGFADTH